jgi:hypothetical protein
MTKITGAFLLIFVAKAPMSLIFDFLLLYNEMSESYFLEIEQFKSHANDLNNSR